VKSIFTALGLAGLICAPCLLALGGGALVAASAVALALAGNPAIQVAALLALVAGAATGWRYLAPRRACECSMEVRGRASAGQPAGAASSRCALTPAMKSSRPDSKQASGSHSA
jgi:membrane protein implicated in regulation of membrane protease activity